MSHSLWELIDSVYVINCDENRWMRMKHRLEPIVPHEKLVKFQAILETDIRIQQSFDPNTSGQIKRMLGCALSHADVWKMIKQKQPWSKKQYSIILEDDVFFRKDWMDVVFDFLSKIDDIDAEWDMLMLNAQGFHSWESGLRKATDLLLSGGYILSHRGLDCLIDLFGELNETTRQISSDYRLLRLQQRGHSYFYFPYLALQEFQESFIAGWGDAQSQDHVIILRTWQETKYKTSYGQLYHWYTDEHAT